MGRGRDEIKVDVLLAICYNMFRKVQGGGCMQGKYKIFRGAMLGLAVGDAMGNTIDGKTLESICADYGPNGLLGYDLVNGYAELSSYTQLAAFVANGLILGAARNQAYSRNKPVDRYVSVALREWARTQQHIPQERPLCWLTDVPELKRRHCMDTRMPDALSLETLGTPQEPVFFNDLPTALTEAVPLALLGSILEMDQEEVDMLAAKMQAMTHGSAEVFLSAAVLTHALCILLAEPDISVKALVESAVDAISQQFGNDSDYAGHLWELLQMAQTLASSDTVTPMEAMEQLRCQTAPEVLAGALYACMISHDDFDTAIITAVNHSGRSAAVGAITGAVLGMRLGEDALPEFYLESLESVALLRQIADDLAQVSIQNRMNRLFDDDWDRKYLNTGN